MATMIRASVVCLLLVFLARPSLAVERWSEAKANGWYDKQPWLVGCNFGPSTAINQLEMWQADTFDLETIDRELGWAADLGFTSIRVFLHHLLWEQDREGLLKRMTQFLEVADRHGIGVMFVPLDDVWDPFPKTGKQRKPKPHLHNSGWVQSPGIEVLKDPAHHDELEGYIKGVIGHFKDDKRVHVWDLYNEPGNPNTSAYGDKELPNKEEMSVKLLRKTFAWAREAKASQPLTSGVWIGTWDDPAKLRPIERVQLEQSDVISFHTYADLKGAEECVRNLRRYNRPILCTEYMARPNGSTFDPILGYFKAERVSAYNWGFVAGKTQTIYPWDSWKKTYTAEPPLWFHDIFRADGTPYIADEVRYIREVTGKAKPASKAPAGAGSIPLSTLDLKQMSSGWGKPQIDKSVAGKPLCIGEQTFAHGVGTHANSEFRIELDGKAERFRAMVGVDAAAGGGDRASVVFVLYDEDDELWNSGVCKLGEAPRACDVPLEGVKFLTLAVTNADDGKSYDHANWADATIAFAGAKPKAAVAPVEEAVILTPPAPATPRINGPTIYGVRPGSPFLYRIPATGERPMTFAAENLPAGLMLDAKSGIITGRLTERGEYPVTLIARNARGKASRTFRIVAGDTLALTPPMGWNSWYIHYHRVSDAIMREAADAMIESGMADYGYQYVNIDDCWMVRVDSDDPEIGGPVRDEDGRILCNKRFPDMKAMTDYIHAKGLKAGTYTSPGPRTCGGYAGAYQHEALDAKTFAEWGFDFLKYDWCSYREV
ncbi:MAG: NPCBM/NEW2 domain-containing protein, partial [Phycisphaerae bacterium]|nr:NPCBM/NEW2 domain-containing protein [Phycisphaerae bacterium]